MLYYYIILIAHRTLFFIIINKVRLQKSQIVSYFTLKTVISKNLFNTY